MRKILSAISSFGSSKSALASTRSSSLNIRRRPSFSGSHVRRDAGAFFQKTNPRKPSRNPTPEGWTRVLQAVTDWRPLARVRMQSEQAASDVFVHRHWGWPPGAFPGTDEHTFELQ